ncbi:MAG TPA: ATP-binding protein [archaeon]|nr:ATP-binding protein [archaeon]
MTHKTQRTVNIRPGITILSVLPHLNYRPWFALSEFVDNSIQSFLDYRSQIAQIDGKDSKLSVSIEINTSDTGSITVRDNAAGIHDDDYARAFRPAALPPDTSGLCEFGMGMKSAACWFSPSWLVRTSAFGEPVERTVRFDIDKIVKDKIEELKVLEIDTDASVHFTEIILTNLYRIPRGLTNAKIKDHLRDIYRVFTREGLMALTFNGEILEYDSPTILVAPFYRTPEASPILWRKEFEFDFGLNLKAKGFAAIRKTGSTSRAGFSLFRRNRLIVGSGEECYRPHFIFGASTTHVYQRLFGEIHLEGFGVSHTKDGFQWDENEQPFLEILKGELSKDEIPLLQQAREYRIERRPQDYQQGANEATTSTAQTIHNHVPPVMEAISSEQPSSEYPSNELSDVKSITRRCIDAEFHGRKWRIIIELTYDQAVGDWLEISDQIAEREQAQLDDESYRVVGLRMSMAHPFMERFSGVDCDQIEPLLRIAAALGLAEIAARDSGVKLAGTIRRNVNELLRDALWKT